jgi:hypothetical protein
MFRSFLGSAMLAVVLAAGLPAQRPPARPAQKLPPPPMGGVRAARQGALIERWNQMPPEERRRALDRLPPERRQKIEEQLERYQNLSPEQRQQLRFRAEMFNQLPPERQDVARRLFRQFNQLPPDRQGLLREEFRTLRALPDEDRRNRIESDDFRGRFNPREQRFLRGFADLLNPAQ